MIIKNKEFVEVVIVIGVKLLMIILWYIVFNFVGIVIVYVILLILGLIIIESFISFFGLGV